MQHVVQTTNSILMIRPVNFDLNEQTMDSNAFQQRERSTDRQTIQQNAQLQFDNFVTRLQKAGITVIVVEDTPDPPTPDSIFPNNWVSFHSNGTVFTYPMQALNRRKERRQDILDLLASKHDLYISKIRDFSSEHENYDRFLEGTGSMVLDRVNSIAYACLSPRTDLLVLTQWCLASGYEAVPFIAKDEHSRAIYHTNVVMCIGQTFAVVCLEAIPDKAEQKTVVEKLEKSGHELIPITLQQMNSFAGNMLQVHNNKNEKILVMSQQAYQSLTPEQIHTLKKHNSHILYSDISTIEQYGGGSARCMMAEVFLPKCP